MSEPLRSKGDHNTCAFARAVHSSPNVLLGEFCKVVSSGGFPVCVGGLCLCQVESFPQ